MKVTQGYRFELDPTPSQTRVLSSHVGASRVAFNRMLADVKSTLDARDIERKLLGGCLTESQGWSLYSLRKRWNEVKHTEFPWWGEVSKEAFNTGLDSLARALANWKAGRAKFPRYRRKGRGPQSIRFTTGTIRVEPDRHHVTLPRVGTIRTHESTRKLARKIEAGTARILSATVTTRAGRWWVSFTVEVERPDPVRGSAAHPVVGVDVGVKTLLTVATPDGTVIDQVENPRAFDRGRKQLRRLQRKQARQQRGSNRQRRTARRVAAAHLRVADVRRDAIHKATTRLAQRHDVIVVEDLNVAGMTAAGGARKRGLNRAVTDAAFAEVRRQLAYKSEWYGAELVVADRWYPSSKMCSGCGERKPSLRLTDRMYECECGVSLDRDVNAAINLARLGVTAGSGPVAGRGADRKSLLGAGGCEASTPQAEAVRRGPTTGNGGLPESDLCALNG